MTKEQNIRKITRKHLFGFNFVDAPDYMQILDEFDRGIDLLDDELPILITPNVDQVVKFNQKDNIQIYSVLKHSKYILPDGQPIVTFSKLIGKGLGTRLTGSDFFPLIWAQLKQRKAKVGFILPNTELGKMFQDELPSVSYYSPPFFDLNSAHEFGEVVDKCTELIQHEKPAYLFIGLGFPKQESLAVAIHEKLKLAMPFTFLLGASFEFYHGTKKRAPKLFQKLYLEFAYRLFTEPRRMAKRYLIDDSYFLILMVKELFGRKSKKKKLFR